MPYIVHKRMNMGENGFHGDTFSNGFGDFSTAKRKRMMSGNNGFYGDTFSDGFGDFSTGELYYGSRLLWKAFRLFLKFGKCFPFNNGKPEIFHWLQKVIRKSFQEKQ